jgi:hypothetical protein
LHRKWQDGYETVAVHFRVLLQYLAEQKNTLHITCLQINIQTSKYKKFCPDYVEHSSQNNMDTVYLLGGRFYNLASTLDYMALNGRMSGK